MPSFAYLAGGRLDRANAVVLRDVGSKHLMSLRSLFSGRVTNGPRVLANKVQPGMFGVTPLNFEERISTQISEEK